MKEYVRQRDTTESYVWPQLYQSQSHSAATYFKRYLGLERVWNKGNPPTLLVGMYVGAATVENSMEAPQKTKNMIEQSHSWAYIQTKL